MARNLNMFTYLPTHIIIIIISFLPFKEAARTSVLSKQWRNVWRATKSLEFNETSFVNQDESVENQEVQRRSFLDFVRQWIMAYNEPIVENFRLSFSRATNFPADVEKWIAFAIDHRVKSLSLDFSDPTWDEEGVENNRVALFELPFYVYGHRILESLKLFSCKFQVSEFKNFSTLTSLSLGWVELTTPSLKAFLVGCPLLETLSLKNCWNLEFLDISAPNLRLTSLVINKCFLDINSIIITAPKLRSLVYSGALCRFNFDGPHCMREAALDFGFETEFIEWGDLLYDILREICCVDVLTVCSYVLQVLPTGEEPLSLSPRMDVKHLILKTTMHENEFFGISFLLKSCPYLETLTIEILPGRIFEDYVPPYDFEAHTFWTQNVLVFKCLQKTLKVVEIKGFKGTMNELRLLKYFITCGRAMKRLNLHISREEGTDGGNIDLYFRNAQILKRFDKASKGMYVWIS
ncbi:hypothetical protein L1049_001437 [Liquidambar formosana]|uniref:F-box domain-containing protein n=1 Tax=Liquidambar formosana TaxID=63359 RepID=A0AAP0NEQ0_LIQFO